MKYDRFERLPVWQVAMELALGVFALTDHALFGHAGGLRDQLRRAAVSVSNNIAEGYERGSTSEVLTFLYIARGSCGEVRSMLRFLERWPPAAGHVRVVSELVALAESCSRQIRAWADSLQNSSIKGQRYLTEQGRVEYQERMQAEELSARLATEQERVVAKWSEEMARAREEKRA
ncbi:MAG: four helix bundle protein [Planctomycetota bacterium]|nr:four helix bundle protein [Planctomycetota bacterium]